MIILLIRHAESVDNVANLLAGSRDSPLTAHGIAQIDRLKHHLSKNQSLGPLRRIYASDLERAWRTAEAVRGAWVLRESAALNSTADQGDEAHGVATVWRIRELREKHFGYLEGVKFGKDPSMQEGFTMSENDVPESRDAMRRRAETFLDEYLIPEMVSSPENLESGSTHETIAVVSHGMILGSLWSALLDRFHHSETFGLSDVKVRWRNTAYLEVLVEPRIPASSPTSQSTDIHERQSPKGKGSLLAGWTIKVLSSNNTDHLVGLKKTGGGIGSARFDEKQRTITGFFTKR